MTCPLSLTLELATSKIGHSHITIILGFRNFSNVPRGIMIHTNHGVWVTCFVPFLVFLYCWAYICKHSSFVKLFSFEAHVHLFCFFFNWRSLTKLFSMILLMCWLLFFMILAFLILMFSHVLILLEAWSFKNAPSKNIHNISNHMTRRSIRWIRSIVNVLSNLNIVMCHAFKLLIYF